jgi:hypothetical protein
MQMNSSVEIAKSAPHTGAYGAREGEHGTAADFLRGALQHAVGPVRDSVNDQLPAEQDIAGGRGSQNNPIHLASVFSELAA